MGVLIIRELELLQAQGINRLLLFFLILQPTKDVWKANL
jgi:hypothetical protein